MAKFPINRSTGSLPGVSGAVPVNYNTDTGVGQIGRAVQGTGQTAFNVNSIIFRKQGVAELTKSMFDAEQKLNKTVMDFETNTDESTYHKKMDQTYAEIRQKEPENGWARQQYRQAMFNLKGKFNGIAQSAVAKRVNDKYEDSLSFWAAQAIQSGDTGVYGLQLNKEVEEGRLTAEKRDLMLAKVQPAADRKNKEIREETAYNSLYQTFTSRLGGPDVAQKQADSMVSKGVIDREEAQRILRQVGSDVKTKQDQAKQAKTEAQYEATRETLVGILNKSVTDPQRVTSLLDQGDITVTQAKSLQSAMVPPDVSDLRTLAAINRKMLEYTLGQDAEGEPVTKKDALDAIIKASPKLKSTTTEALVNDLTTGVSQTTAKALTDSNRSMKNIIGSVSDMFGNIIIGSDFEQVALDDAELFLAREIREARAAEKPMTNEDIRIRAIELAYQAKSNIPEDPRNAKPEMRFKKRVSYGRLYESMSDKYKAVADKLKTDGKTEKEILELFYGK